jgi:hypothetical protein
MRDLQLMNFGSVEELDQPVYRIMKQQHVISLFRDRRNAMNKFGNWKDNFENFLMRCGHEANGIKSDNTHRERMVAQCWTKEKFSEAMWGIYANDPEERFLRIRSTPRKLLNALACAQPKLANELCCVGRVEYKTTSQIKAIYDGNKSAEVSMQLLFQSLLLKRKAFSHEREVRLVHCVMFGSLDGQGLFWYDVDPHEMISQIMADPNRNRTKWNTEKDQIRSQTGFRGEIKRSKIYDAPEW